MVMFKKFAFYSSLITLSLAAIGPAAAYDAPAAAFYPATGWNATGTAGAAGNCTLVSKYNNGFFLQFQGAGQGKAIQSIHLDLRQNAFTQGQDVPVTLTVPGKVSQALTGKAGSPQVLAIDVGAQGDLLASLQGASALDLDIGGSAFRFFLTGFSNALGGFQACLNGEAAPAPVAAAPVAAPVPAPAMTTPPAATPAAEKTLAVQEAASEIKPDVKPEATSEKTQADAESADIIPLPPVTETAATAPAPQKTPAPEADVKNAQQEAAPEIMPTAPSKTAESAESVGLNQAQPESVTFESGEPVRPAPAATNIQRQTAQQQKYEAEMARILPQEDRTRLSETLQKQMQEGGAASIDEAALDARPDRSSARMTEKLATEMGTKVEAAAPAGSARSITADKIEQNRKNISAVTDAPEADTDAVMLPVESAPAEALEAKEKEVLEKTVDTPDETSSLAPMPSPAAVGVAERAAALKTDKQAETADIVPMPIIEAAAAQEHPPEASPTEDKTAENKINAANAPENKAVENKSEEITWSGERIAVAPVPVKLAPEPAVSKGAAKEPADQSETTEALIDDLQDFVDSKPETAQISSSAPAAMEMDMTPPPVVAPIESAKMKSAQADAPALDDSAMMPLPAAEAGQGEITAETPVIVKPAPKVTSISSPDIKVSKSVMKGEADFTNAAGQEDRELPTRRAVAPMDDRMLEMERNMVMLKQENEALNKELEMSLKASEDERLEISSDNWNLEKATMQFNEAERQIARLGQQIQKERAQHAYEKKELEMMLFDPQVTEEAQLAHLSMLEQKLKAAQAELDALRAAQGQ